MGLPRLLNGKIDWWGKASKAGRADHKERERRRKEALNPKIGGISDAFQFDTEPVKDKEKWDFLE